MKLSQLLNNGEKSVKHPGISNEDICKKFKEKNDIQKTKLIYMKKNIKKLNYGFVLMKLILVNHYPF